MVRQKSPASRFGANRLFDWRSRSTGRKTAPPLALANHESSPISRLISCETCRLRLAASNYSSTRMARRTHCHSRTRSIPASSRSSPTKTRGFIKPCQLAVAFSLTDETKVLEQGFRAVWALLSEGELRAQLALVGFSEAAIESGIQVAR